MGRKSNRAAGLLTLVGVGLTGIGAQTVSAQIVGPGFYAWGNNPYGEVGNGTISPPYGYSTSASRVLGVGGSGFLGNITQVGGGEYHSVALSGAGNVYDWGNNNDGRLGNGTTTASTTPVEVVGVGGVGNLSNVAVLAGGYDFNLALNNAGNIYEWGNNLFGQLGNGNTTNSSTPVEVQGVGGVGFLSNVTAMAGGGNHSMALSGGNVYTWGFNFFDQLGNGNNTSSSTPMEVVGVGGTGHLANVTVISAGGDNCLVVTSGGNVYGWGTNSNGQLGNGNTTNQATPVEVVGVGGTGVLSNVISVAAASDHSLALTSSGSVYAWGDDNDGQLGNGVASNSSTLAPILVPVGHNGSAHVISIFAGDNSSFALESDGSLWAWGNNSVGQFGIGTITNSLTPIEIYTPSGGYGITAFSPEELGDTSLAVVTALPEPSCVCLVIGVGLIGMRRRGRSRRA